METQEKASDFEAKGFLNNYVFFMSDKEPPLMKDVLVNVGSPIQKLEKQFSEKRIESEKLKNHPHSHTYT